MVYPNIFGSCPQQHQENFTPDQDAGEGGLVRHSRMVCEVAISLMELEMWQPLKQYENEIYAACLIHDTWKLGEVSEYIPKKTWTKHEHPLIASKKFQEFAQNYPGLTSKMKEQCKIICECVETHMGQWNEFKYSKVVLRKPFSPVQKFVHLCDYIASRNFIGNLDKIQ